MISIRTALALGAAVFTLILGTRASAEPTPAESPTPAPVAESRSTDQAGYIYTYGLRDARYNDQIISIDAYKPIGAVHSRLRPYISGTLVRDSRTGIGRGTQPPTPIILSDNYTLVAGGIQYTLPTGLRVFAQAGKSAPFGAVASVPSGGDVRYGIQLYRDIGSPFSTKRGYGSFYGSATYFNRYNDTIVYLQAETIRNLASARHPIEAFVRIVANGDTRKFYYSNLVEATSGVRFHPLGKTGPILSIEGALGAYIIRGTLPAGVTSNYRDFRPTMSFGSSL